MENNINKRYKSFTSLEQSKKLAEILPVESADMTWEQVTNALTKDFTWKPTMGLDSAIKYNLFSYRNGYVLPCWSLAALLWYLKTLKSLVYLPMLFANDEIWILQFVERGHGNVAEITSDNPVDACYEMILKLHEQKLL